MKATQLVELTEAVIKSKTNASLSRVQKIVLQECCQEQSQTYEQIALAVNYSPNYLKKKVIPSLWKTLSEVFSEKVTKANCRSILEKNVTILENLQSPEIPPDRPEGPLPLNSPFYIHRFDLEGWVCKELSMPGALLCLRGTSKIGKTSLLLRSLDSLEKRYKIICLSLNEISELGLSSTETFLRWLCANITQHFESKICLQEFWQDEIGALTNCSLYFKKYLLSCSQSPVIVALDKFERLFTHPTVMNDFLCLLQLWYEKAKSSLIWQKLRFILIYSTEEHLLLTTHKPLIKIVQILDIPSLNILQIQELANAYQLALTIPESEHLLCLTGGHSNIVQSFFYDAVRYPDAKKKSLSNFGVNLEFVNNHLQEKLYWLERDPNLITAYQKLINSNQSVVLTQEIAFKLQSLGLIYKYKNVVRITCELYREYFRARLT